MVVDYLFSVVHSALPDLDAVSVDNIFLACDHWESACLVGRGICVRCWYWCPC